MTTLETGGPPIDLQQHTRFLHAILQHLGPAYAAFFATPTQTENGDTLAWVTPENGPVTRFDALPAQDRQVFLNRIQQAYAAIGQVPVLQGAWSQMQRFPDSSALWVVGTQPLITRWGLPGLAENTLISPSYLANSTHSVFPFFYRAPKLMAPALIGSGLGLLAAVLLFWRLARFFSALCVLPPHPPLPAPTQNTQAAADDAQLAHNAGGHSGKLEIILTWQDKNDLDLHVFPPNEQQIFFQNRIADGGFLDLDANQAASRISHDSNGLTASLLNSARNMFGSRIVPPTSGDHVPPLALTNHPVEHVTWANNPPTGHYTVQVDPYAMPYSETSPYRVSVFYNGSPLVSRNGVAQRNHTILTSPRETTILEFDIPN
ncbi:hypothetical protein [Acetobacter persici]|uniref:hypothetical protein n=1 Tax=Acetobacter persici TaxID=1076596 RepID=UPI001BA5E3FA|nr:hypothetical protein [Acetobacter persici]MBS1016959.1 hypothetical protein [Acetobacter persici]